MSKPAFWALPSWFVHIVKQRDVSAENCERSEQQCAFALVGERVRDGTGVGGVHAPLAPACRDAFEVDELGKKYPTLLLSSQCPACAKSTLRGSQESAAINAQAGERDLWLRSTYAGEINLLLHRPDAGNGQVGTDFRALSNPRQHPSCDHSQYA